MFYGGSGYIFALLIVHLEIALPVAAILAILCAILFAVVVGMIIIRASGIAFAMLTLAVGMLVYVAVTQNRSITNGFDGFSIPLEGSLFGIQFQDLLNPATAWPFIWAILLLAIGGLWLVGRTVFGRELGALRENEERARFIGLQSFLPKLAAFAISACVASIAGVFSAMNHAFVSPDSLFWAMSGHALVVAVIGGVGSVWGAPAGAFIFVFLQSAFLGTSYYEIVLGAVLIVIVVVSPGGLAEIVGRAANAVSRRMRKATS